MGSSGSKKLPGTVHGADWRQIAGCVKLTIRLPWPAAALFVNRSNGRRWMARRAAAVKARSYAGFLTLQAALGRRFEIGETAAVEYEFHPPRAGRYDADGLLSACKAYQDGIADALGVDDSAFWPVTLVRGEAEPGGSVVVTVIVTEGQGER